MILITGGTGLLGKALIETNPSYNIIPTYFPNKPDTKTGVFNELNITDKDKVLSSIKLVNPDVIIHTAAIGDVDYCEKNKDKSWATNVEGTKNIIEAAKECNAKIIYISSNAVFDGSNPPYREEDRVNPLSYYGETKVVCERLVRNSGLDYAIVRAILMYGWNNPLERQNMLTWILGSKTPLKIVDDIYSNPLLATNCAEAIWAIIKKKRTGIYHVAGADCMSRYDFALKIVEVFGLDISISPVPDSYFGFAPRPLNTCLCTEKMTLELVKPISVYEGLNILKGEYDRTIGNHT